MRRALALVVLALGLRLAGAAASADIPLTFDPIDFDRHARSIVVNHGYPGAVHPRGGPSALRPPGYPLALAAAYLLRGGAAAPEPTDVAFAPGHQPPRAQVTAGRVQQALIGTLMVVLTGLVALQLWGRRVALAALAIGAVYLPLIAVGLTLLSDPLFVVLMLAAVSAALRSRDQERPAAGRRWAAVAGALAGLAWLTRSNGGALLLPLGLLVWTARPRLRLRSLAAPAVMVAAALLVIAPWTIRNAIVLDAFVPVSDNAGYTLAGTYNPVAAHDAHFRGGWRPAQEDPGNAALIAASRDELDQARRLGRAARRYIREDPSYVLVVAGCNTLRLVHLGALACGDDWAGPRRGYEGEFGLSPALATVAIASFGVLAVLALLGALTRGARAAPLALWLVPVVLWTVVFVQAATRFRAPVEPFLIMLAALALVTGADRARGRRG